MRESGRERGGGRGWLTTIGGALLLVVLGFGVGLVAGSLFEEPELVAKQLAGEATELPLPAETEDAPAASPGATAPRPAPPSETAAAAPEPSAPRPEPAEPDAAPGEVRSDFETGDEPSRAKPGALPEVAAQPPVEPPRAAPPPAPRPAPAAPPAPAAKSAGFAVQVGAFAERAAADQLVARLRGDRFPAYIAQGQPGEAARFRVRVGPYPTRDEASRHAGRLKERRRLPTWVIREGGP